MNNFLQKTENGLYLTQEQMNILIKYGFDYNKYKNLKQLIFDLEYYLNECDCDELEQISLKLSEFDYYNNTNK